MLTESKYRNVAFILTLIFCLYNVGLPIVISACPMTSNQTSKFACCADTQTDGSKISSTKNTSCCTIIIAAKPNKTEYLQVNIQFENLNSYTLIFLQSLLEFNSAKFSSSFASVTSFFSPPVKDIPVFTSTLLI